MRQVFSLVVLFVLPHALCASEAIPGDSIEISANSLHLRSTPSLEGEIIQSLAKGKRALVLDTVSDWLKVSLGNQEGFINAEFTTRLVPDGFYSWFKDGWMYGGLIVFTLLFGGQVAAERVRDKRFKGGYKQGVVPGGALIKSMLSSAVIGLFIGLGYAVYMWFKN